MAGSAILDEDVLVDSLVPTVDELRSELHAAFGVRHFRVFVVTRTWSGASPGLPGTTFTDTEVELDPAPLVEPYGKVQGGLHYKLEPCGLDVAGILYLSEISLTYTEAELGDSFTANVQKLYRVSEGHGQLVRTRYFVLNRPPFPDRVKNIGWEVELVDAKVAPAASAFTRKPVVTNSGEQVYAASGEAVWST